MPSLAPISMIGFFFAARAISMSDFTSAMTAFPRTGWLRRWMRFRMGAAGAELRGDLSFPLRLRQPACKIVSLEENCSRTASGKRSTGAGRIEPQRLAPRRLKTGA
jgi:hypothetical protein